MFEDETLGRATIGHIRPHALLCRYYAVPGGSIPMQLMNETYCVTIKIRVIEPISCLPCNLLSRVICAFVSIIELGRSNLPS